MQNHVVIAYQERQKKESAKWVAMQAEVDKDWKAHKIIHCALSYGDRVKVKGFGPGTVKTLEQFPRFFRYGIELDNNPFDFVPCFEIHEIEGLA